MTLKVEVPIENVRPNPWNPRRGSGEDTSGLVTSIGREGLLQVPMGRPRPGFDLFEIADAEGHWMDLEGATVELAFGHRRLLAVEELGWKTVPITVHTLDDSQMVQYALAENRERVAVEEIEELEAPRQALDQVEGLKQQDVAAWMGWSRTTLTKRLKVLVLPEQFLDKVRKGEMSVRAGLELLAYRGSDGHCHEDLMEKTLAGIYGDKTVERVIQGVCEARPNNWLAVKNVDKEERHLTHRIRIHPWVQDTALYLCDVERCEEILKRSREQEEAAFSERLEAFRPLVDLEESLVRKLLSMLRPAWRDANSTFYKIMGTKGEEFGYRNWTESYDAWASKAAPEVLLDVIAWHMKQRDKDWE